MVFTPRPSTKEIGERLGYQSNQQPTREIFSSYRPRLMRAVVKGFGGEGQRRGPLVGLNTWLMAIGEECSRRGVVSVPKNTPLKEDEDPPDEEDGGELPEVEEKKEEIEEIEDEEKKNKPKRGRPRKPRPEDDGVDGFEEMEIDLGGENPGKEEKPEDGEEQPPEGEDEEKDYEVKVLRMLAPEGVLHAVADMILRLKADGFEVVQVHSDNGGEFVSSVMKKWMINRGYIRTYTAGDDPQSNQSSRRKDYFTKEDWR